MVQHREDLGFAAEPRDAFSIVSETRREDLHCDIASEFWVAGAIHLSHAPTAKGRQNFVRSEASAKGQEHETLILAVEPRPANGEPGHGSTRPPDVGQKLPADQCTAE